MTKEKAIDILRVINPPRESKRIFDEFVQAIDMAIEALEESKQKYGKWITKEENYITHVYCSECGKPAMFVFVTEDYYGNYAHGESKKTNYCPNCGARMTKKDEDNV